MNRICEKNKFIFLSHNSKVLQTRITEFTKTYSLTGLEKENLSKVKRQKKQGKSTSGIQGYYYNREEYMARKKRERQNKLKNKQQKRKKHRKKKKNLTTKKRKKNKVNSQKNFSIRL